MSDWRHNPPVHAFLQFLLLLKYPLSELPQVSLTFDTKDKFACSLQFTKIYFTLHSMLNPASIPIGLASAHLIESTSRAFTGDLYDVITRGRQVAWKLQVVQTLYSIASIPNKVPDGTIPFPEDTSTIKSGVLIEFK